MKKLIFALLFCVACDVHNIQPQVYGCASGRSAALPYVSARVVYACQTVGEFAADTTTAYVDRQWSSICTCKH